MLRKLTLSLRYGWNSVADALSLRQLPPVPTVALVLAVGVLVPLSGKLQVRTADLANSLALDRIGRFATSTNHSKPRRVGPQGSILSTRPAIYWKRDESSARYVVRVLRDDGTAWINGAATTHPYYVISAAGALEAQQNYTFEVRGYDHDGNRTVTHTGSFAIDLPSDGLKKLQQDAHKQLDAFESSLVLSGYYAEQGSQDDVVSGLLAAYQANPAAFRREFAASRSSSARDWMARHIDPLTQPSGS